jgi:hypothetical protein
VRLEQGVVSGICGPLSWYTALDYEFDPAGCTFDESELAIRRARETPEQFVRLDRWMTGDIDYRPRLVEVTWSLLAEWAFRVRRWLRG